MKDKYIFDSKGFRKASCHALKTIELMKQMKIGQTVLLASIDGNSLFIKIPMVQKDVMFVYNEADELSQEDWDRLIASVEKQQQSE